MVLPATNSQGEALEQTARRKSCPGSPHVVGGLPDFGRRDMIAPHLGARGDREVGVDLCTDECEPDIVVGFDLVFLCAVQIGHEPDDASVAIGP